jgi:glutamyl-Q tRNA(Asp) synthetase
MPGRRSSRRIGAGCRGHFPLRIEDIDGARSRPELADQFRADLAWLGLAWREVRPQSQRIASLSGCRAGVAPGRAALSMPLHARRIAAAAQGDGP